MGLVLTRCNPCYLLEYSAEVMRIVIAYRLRYLIDLQIGMLQHFLGFRNTQLDDIVNKFHSHFPAEYAAEIIWR